MVHNTGKLIPVLLLLILLAASSCSRLEGYGVLLWSSEEPAVPSGTVLPVYIRSNIDHVWVVGIPKEFRTAESQIDKFEIPISKLELAGSRKKAVTMAENFAPYSLTYAETLQDGLPIRESADNGARRVYRLKLGEIVKILEPAKGVSAVGTTGAPLPGEWYRVLTEDGVSGYCFSYRLKLFEHRGGALAAIKSEEAEEEDPDLEQLLSRVWYPESYGAMVSGGRIDLEELSHSWRFDPGAETGIAHIRVKDMDRTFSYTRIRSIGTRSWAFEGTQLQMNLRSDTTLAVQFTEGSGILRTLIFVSLLSDVDDIILQETARREELFKSIYEQGPVFTSNSYGTLSFREDGHFTWTGNMLLVPQVIPASALGSGTLDMRLYLASSLREIYAGAFTLYFDGISGEGASADFMYSIDTQGFRIEHVPQTGLDGITVVRRASTPLVIYFFKNDMPAENIPGDFSAPFNTPESAFEIPGAGDFAPEDDSFFTPEPDGSAGDDEPASGETWDLPPAYQY